MDIYETHQGTHILQSLDGFAFALSNDGRFLYISETVSIYLGLSQIEMAGSSIFDYVHQQDHAELAEQLCVTIPSVGSSVSSAGSGSDEESSVSTPRALSPTIHDRTSLMNLNPSKGYDRSFCIRMKSTLTKRGVHVKTSGYRVVYLEGRFRPQFSFTMGRKHPAPLLGLVGLAIALPPPTITELRIEADTFITRLGPELKVIYCENAISNLMDLTSDDLSNKILYDFCHPGDIHILRKSHVDLINKGQTLTEYYRLMNKHGGYVWVQTCITSLCGSKSPDELNSIAINYVLGGIEFGGCVMDKDQLQTVIGKEIVHSNHSDSEPSSEEENTTSKDAENDNRLSSRNQTRACSESNQTEGRISSSDQVTLEGCSPNENPSYSKEKAPARNYIVYHDKTDTGQKDSKNSRRKMDRPRKRRRDYDSDDDSLDGTTKRFDGDVTRIPHIDSNYNHKGATDEHMNAAVSCSRLSESPDMVRSNRASSPGPQDLSVKSCSVSQTGLQDGNTVEWERVSSESDMLHGAGASTVKDLEDAMNRHLPTIQPSDASAEYEQDFNSTSLTENYSNKHKSTIQWIGSNQSTASETLPASNLLRSLYASRESVIRSSTRPHYYSELPANMLTPPGGSDGYKDHGSFSVYPLASTMNTKSHTTGAAPYPPMSSYSTSPISISMATNMTDSYSITPPSSVSPEDKLQSPTIADPNYHDNLSSEISGLRIPVKPQTYAMALTVPSAIDYEPVKNSAYHNVNYSRNGTDYYHPHIINNGGSAAMCNQAAHDQGAWFASTFQSP